LVCPFSFFPSVAGPGAFEPTAIGEAPGAQGARNHRPATASDSLSPGIFQAAFRRPAQHAPAGDRDPSSKTADWPSVTARCEIAALPDTLAFFAVLRSLCGGGIRCKGYRLVVGDTCLEVKNRLTESVPASGMVLFRLDASVVRTSP
jgi:hypothetical protein